MILQVVITRFKNIQCSIELVSNVLIVFLYALKLEAVQLNGKLFRDLFFLKVYQHFKISNI